MDFIRPVQAKHMDAVASRVRDRPFLHLWQEMFRSFGDDRIDRPEDGSFLAVEFARVRALRRAALSDGS